MNNDFQYSITKHNLSSNTTYAMWYSTFYSFITGLMSGAFSSDWTFGSLLSSMSEYVVSSIYYPIKITPFIRTKTSTTSIDVGTKTVANTDALKDIITYNSITWFHTPIITKTHNNFLDYEPYTKKTLYLPFFEPIELPLNIVYGKRVFVDLSLDISTGYLGLVAYCYNSLGDYIMIANRKCKIGIDIPIGRTNREEINRNNVVQALNLVGGVSSLAYGIGTGNPLATVGGVGLTTKTIGQSLMNNVEHLTGYKGANGDTTFLNCDTTIKIYTETVTGINVIDTHLVGKPLRQYMDFSNLTGFTKASNITLGTPVTSYGKPVIMDDEMTELNTLLESGIWLNFNDVIS